MSQLTLPNLKVVEQKVIDDLELGVLEDGTAFISLRGLARLADVAPSAPIQQGLNWKNGKRDGKLGRMLQHAGITRDLLHVATTSRGEYAYPEDVAMVFLEYYAFEVTPPNPTAQRNYRTLARAGFRAFVYNALGYDPRQAIPPYWRQFHDRQMLNSVPLGFFSVFREMSEVVVHAAQHGLQLNAHTIPDISIGQTWAAFWLSNDLAAKHGERRKFPHTYPDYFPQAKAGDIEAWIYSLDALPAFRTWLYGTYLPSKFPSYLERQVKRGQLPASTADLILKAIEPKTLPELPPGR